MLVILFNYKYNKYWESELTPTIQDFPFKNIAKISKHFHKFKFEFCLIGISFFQFEIYSSSFLEILECFCKF